MKRLLGILPILFAACAFADVSYTVTVDKEAKAVFVSMTLPAEGGNAAVQMPNWAPGSYVLSNPSVRVKEMTATSGGKELDVEKPNANTWSVTEATGDSVTFRYRLDQTFPDDRAHLTGPSTYCYAVGRIQEPCTVEFKLPDGWDAICGLEEPNRHRFVAPTYDVLADAPVSVGRLTTDSYTSHGVPHTIVYFGGDPEKVDRGAVLKMCQKISDYQGEFFGGLPFKKYVWHFRLIEAPDGGGGLEHLSSTTITLATGLGAGVQSVCVHEYFHAWNVKRIRSKVLGPFDYTVLPKTGALWWLEGVTDYYASLLPYRYGHLDKDFLYGSLVRNVDRTRANKQRMEVSPYDASYRVGEAAGGRGNSQGFGVNYYNTGWVLGLCLDLELRSRTEGRASLDDVVYALWEMCKDDQPGFEEDEIRKQLVRFGGAEMGGIYDKWVMQPGELPVEEQLAKVGLKLDAAERAFPVVGAVFGQASESSKGIPIESVTENAGSTVQVGDVLVGVGSQDFTEARGNRARGTATNAILGGAKIGDLVTVKVRRGDAVSEQKLAVTKETRTVRSVVEVPNPTERQLAARRAWFKGAAKTMPAGA